MGKTMKQFPSLMTYKHDNHMLRTLGNQNITSKSTPWGYLHPVLLLQTIWHVIC